MIYIVRHGQTDHNVNEISQSPQIPLNETGMLLVSHGAFIKMLNWAINNKTFDLQKYLDFNGSMKNAEIKGVQL